MLYAGGDYSGDYAQTFGLSGFNHVRASLYVEQAFMQPFTNGALQWNREDTHHSLSYKANKAPNR
jgi:hypothetical protein